jgi:proton-translocating NADH-quinone oxidoreductase chain L
MAGPFEWLLPYAWVTVFLPALGFVLVAALGRDKKRGNWWLDGGALLGIVTVASAAVLSFLIFIEVWAFNDPYFSPHPWVWMRFGTLYLGTGLHIDGLSALLMFVVSFLSTCIAVYSTAYMHEESALKRYYFEILLFITGMMGMVVVDNYLFAFIFWEMMGLCSYLLIGYWYTKPSAASAAKKAFLVTRAGDILFLFGILLLFNNFGTLNYNELFETIRRGFAGHTLTPDQFNAVGWAGLLIFGGAVGKSAQFPLHVWLPDAMEGPTTVSALIHAATMVKAGVYITARSLPILALFPGSLALIAIIGAFTAFLAATIALVVYDIKRVLAYSTISQLAYMFMGLGTLGVGPALFHLMNHAFFKALLFLGSGSVIHGAHTQDMRKMGGLKDKMPWTFRTMLVGSLSLAGFPLVSGWWSKDEILSSAAQHASAGGYVWGPFGLTDYAPIGWTIFALGLATAGLTGFYTFRMVYMTFYGKPRYDEEHVHVHESPGPMVNVLKVLMVFAAASGAVTVAVSTIYPNFFEDHVVVEALHGQVTQVPSLVNPVAYLSNPVLYASTLVALGGIWLAWMTYRRGTVSPKSIVGLAADPDHPERRVGGTAAGRALFSFFTLKWGMDHLYLKIAALGDGGIARGADWLDRRVIDGTTYMLQRGSFGASEALKRAADGVVRNYTAWIIAGLALCLILLKYIVPAVAGGGSP